MSQYSAKERLIAGLLSSTPGLKRIVKRAYTVLNAVMHRKSYRYCVLQPECGDIRFVAEGSSFFGYYDHSPERNGRVAYHIPGMRTDRNPNPEFPVTICIATRDKGIRNTGCTTSYNWQQGARLMWLDDNRIIYNQTKDDKYVATVCDAAAGTTLNMLPLPVQEIVDADNYLSIDPRRITALQSDYGYTALPAMNAAELADLDNDGIHHVNISTGRTEMVHTLRQIATAGAGTVDAKSRHCANHIMSSPGGDRFIFIHRWYVGGRRHDRLMLSDYNTLHVLADDGMVSHMTWVDDNTLFGYFRHSGVSAFHFIDLNRGTITPSAGANSLGQGDGHPTAWGDWIAFDSYPDKSRMQHLTLLNRRTGDVLPLLEVYHGLAYDRDCRCDLHPRFSDDGRRLWFDTVLDGKRRLAYIDVSAITSVNNLTDTEKDKCLQ